MSLKTNPTDRIQRVKQRFDNETIGRTVHILALAVVATIMIGPFLYMFAVSLMKPGTVQQLPPKFIPSNPVKWGLHNYERVLTNFNFTRFLLNSLLVTSIVTVFNLFFDTLAGYVFAKLEFPGRKVLFMTILATLMIPSQITIVPLYILMDALGFINTYIGLTVPFAASAFGIFLMKQFIETIPSDLERAAMVDGCSRFEVFYKVIVPLSKPAMATLGIFTFIGTWNSFLWPLLIAQDQSMYTLEVALAQFQGRFEQDLTALMTGMTLTSIPVIILFVSLQKYYVQGIKLSGIKA
ncbi:carbohydrate ABC transporter permease [Halorussus salinus]|uniref:carbohydrate ABC transporter permease n=1 Tax=Halorussus salinus TaxID=1364935 RepID=UPI0010930EF8|nr:carbohydrate ABC transporter permease [Halorussus salinus]